jgi:1,4-dihydroxy-2-naphthoate octaprenyltransferase
VTTPWRNLITHLRIRFQLLLAPVFLWGWLVAGGGFSWRIVLAFISFHAFLYTGATAFNSYYDRDEGPIGGLEHPPPVPSALLPLSLAMKVIGAVIAVFVNVQFLAVYACFAVLSIAYSHPRIRLKARPWSSLLVVGFGQGVLAFLGAWAATRGELASALSLDGILGALAAMLLILALYPLTQLYQLQEDSARGDWTVAVAWGPRRCFDLSLALTVVGGVMMVALLGMRFGVFDALLVLAGLALQAFVIARWSRSFDPTKIHHNFRRVSTINETSAVLLAAYLLSRLVR